MSAKIIKIGDECGMFWGHRVYFAINMNNHHSRSWRIFIYF